MRDLAPIVSEAPARRLPATAAEALAMYAIAKPTSRAELVNLAALIRGELDRIHAILDDVNQRLSEKSERDAGKNEENDHA